MRPGCGGDQGLPGRFPGFWHKQLGECGSLTLALDDAEQARDLGVVVDKPV